MNSGIEVFDLTQESEEKKNHLTDDAHDDNIIRDDKFLSISSEEEENTLKDDDDVVAEETAPTRKIIINSKNNNNDNEIVEILDKSLRPYESEDDDDDECFKYKFMFQNKKNESKKNSLNTEAENNSSFEKGREERDNNNKHLSIPSSSDEEDDEEAYKGNNNNSTAVLKTSNKKKDKEIDISIIEIMDTSILQDSDDDDCFDFKNSKYKNETHKYDSNSSNNNSPFDKGRTENEELNNNEVKLNLTKILENSSKVNESAICSDLNFRIEEQYNSNTIEKKSSSATLLNMSSDEDNYRIDNTNNKKKKANTSANLQYDSDEDVSDSYHYNDSEEHNLVEQQPRTKIKKKEKEDNDKIMFEKEEKHFIEIIDTSFEEQGSSEDELNLESNKKDSQTSFSSTTMTNGRKEYCSASSSLLMNMKDKTPHSSDNNSPFDERRIENEELDNNEVKFNLTKILENSSKVNESAICSDLNFRIEEQYNSNTIEKKSSSATLLNMNSDEDNYRIDNTNDKKKKVNTSANLQYDSDEDVNDSYHYNDSEEHNLVEQQPKTKIKKKEDNDKIIFEKEEKHFIEIIDTSFEEQGSSEEDELDLESNKKDSQTSFSSTTMSNGRKEYYSASSSLLMNMKDKTPRRENKCKKTNTYESDDDDDSILGKSPVFKTKRNSSMNDNNDEDCSISSYSKSYSNSELAPSSYSESFKSYHDNSNTRITKPTTATATTTTLAKKQQKETEKQQKATQREKKKQTRELDKQHKEIEKQSKAQEREKQRQDKKRKKEVDATQKASRVQYEQQLGGKFAEKEICMVMEQSLSESELGMFIQSSLVMEEYSVMTDGCSENLGSTSGMIRWIRKNYTSGGADSAMKDLETGNINESYTRTEWMNVVVVVFYDSNSFLQLLDRDSNNATPAPATQQTTQKPMVQFPKLQEYIDTLQKNTNNIDRYVFILHNIKERLSLLWKKGGKRRKSFTAVTEDDLQDSILFLLMEYNIDVEITRSSQDAGDFLTSLSKCMAYLPYFEPSTELHCIKKLKTKPFAEEQTSTLNNNNPIQECWFRQIQQFPSISEAMANQFLNSYPSPKSLIDNYQDAQLTNEQKRTLVMKCFSEKKNNVKASNGLYRFMTSENPLELMD